MITHRCRRRATLVGGALAALALAVAPAAAQTFTPVDPEPVDPGNVVPIDPIPICQLIRNGSFQDGLFTWFVDPCEEGFGDHQESASAEVVDLTGTPGGDDDVACLSIFSEARWTCEKPSGSASQGQITLRKPAKVTARYLTFKVFGGFGFCLFSEGQVKYTAQVVVHGPNGVIRKCEIIDSDFQGGNSCNTGLCADGIIPVRTICCDVLGPATTPTGIQLGDNVEIEVTWSATAVACNDCDFAQFGGVLYVDRFQFCHFCLMVAPLPIPVDEFTVISDVSELPAPANELGEFDRDLADAIRLDFETIDSYRRENMITDDPGALEDAGTTRE